MADTHTVQASRFGYDTVTSVTIAADATVTQDFALNQLPSGTVAGIVSDSETGMGVSASIAVKLMGTVVLTVSTNPATGAYSFDLPVGRTTSCSPRCYRTR